MLRLTNITCRRDARVLFDNASLLLNRGHRIGITGANGSGKTSLFKLILGELEPDTGELDLQGDITIAHVAQETRASTRSALDFVIDGDERLRALEASLQDEAVDGMQRATLLEEYDDAGGYSAHARAGELLFGLGFGSVQHTMSVSEFSGGWRMRLNLAQALMCRSDLLLLDEPTNHLDLDAVLWLEGWLRRYDGLLLLISHDREFLDRTISRIANIEGGRLDTYTGNYSDFERIRSERLANQAAAYQQQQRRASEMERFVERFRAKATKARQAQSRLKMLERMTLTAPAQVTSPFHFHFQPPDKSPDLLVSMRSVSVGYDDKPVLQKCTMNLQAGDRIALLGMNGAGKSTFIKALVGELPLLAGERVPAAHLQIGYFAQHQVDRLDHGSSALEVLSRLDRSLTESQVRDHLGRFGFSGDAALQQVDTMSGGEKARLALALIVHQRPNLLVLDEPTNHLDIQMRHALSEALQSFEGALLVVSHDRFLLQAAADELWLVADATVKPFDDDLDGYAAWLQRSRQAQAKAQAESAASAETATLEEDAATTANTASAGSTAATPMDRKAQKRLEAEHRKTLQPLRRQVERQEKRMDELQRAQTALQDQLSDNRLYSNDAKAELAGLLQQQGELKHEIDACEAEWLDALEALESLEARLQSH